MTNKRQVLFNHIPKTGGVTLRIILNRVYGGQNVFLIRSMDIGGSLEKFSSLPEAERARFSVVAGHGAGLFSPLVEQPFRITILRDPIALFISQYHYLKNNREAGFYDQVSSLETVEEYLAFATENGQDNLLTRYLSNSVRFLADPATSIPDMRKEGDLLLEKALTALHEYDAIIDLADFDAGVYELAGKLGWKRIPLYRPSNRNSKNRGIATVPDSALHRMQEALKWDIALYLKFKEERIACGIGLNRSALAYKLFLMRQGGISLLSKGLTFAGLRG